MEKKFNQTKYINDFKRTNYKRYVVELSKDKDADIIAYLEKQPNKQKALKEALRNQLTK